jgi:hypothetical protein
MHKYLSIVFVLLLFNCCNNGDDEMKLERKAIAEQWFRGVYGSDPSVVDDLAADDVTISYPIFETLFNTSAIRGREAAKNFATGFCERWTDTQITIHDAVAEGNRVILIWSFRGRNIGSARQDRTATNQEHSWGGITLFHFNSAGKIMGEIGEESEPGPFERLAAPPDKVS